MNDAQRIQNLIYSYAEFVDDGDFEALAGLFARGSVSYSPGGLVLHGSKEVAEFYTRTVKIDPATGTPRTVHRVTNTILVPGEQEWHARSRYDVMFQEEGEAPRLIATGRYFDTFNRDGDSWVYHHRKIVSEFLGEAKQHLNLDAGELHSSNHVRAIGRT